MGYILPIILVIVSYFLGVYFASQGLKSITDRPLAYSSETIVFILTILFGWIPTFIALYLSYINVGLLFTGILLLVRFVLMPTVLNNKVKSFMEKNHI